MHMQFFKPVLILVGVALIGALIFAFSGMFNPAADEPHWWITYKALHSIRERGVTARARDIEVPNLNDPALIRSGAGNYAAMCVGCHLAPGEPPEEIQRGMYPAPPNLSEGDVLDAGRTFWTIKHGIKMTGMPAWGESMGDAPIWGMTAFVRQLPAMTAEQYKTLVAASGGHDHGDGATQGQTSGPDDSNGGAEEAGHAGMKGMQSMEGMKDPQNGAAEESGRLATDDPAETSGMTGMDHDAMAGMDEARPPGISDTESESMQGMDHSAMAGMKVLPKTSTRRISGPAEAALQGFQDALQVGNRDLAMQWLASDVKIVEGGKIEPSRDAYASHHMGSDMAFLKSSSVILLDRRVHQSGDGARIESTSRIVGSAGGKPVNIISKEIALLENTTDGWRIVRLEWSSGPVEN